MTQALANSDPAELERQRLNQANAEALVRIKKNPDYVPLSCLIPEEIAAEVEPWFKNYKKFNAKSRVALFAMAKWYLTEGNWAKSQSALCRELGLTSHYIYYWKTKWPEFFLIVNRLMKLQADQQLGRVLSSMTDAAVEGDSRDRRLYLEYFGHIKQEQRAGGQGTTIVFVNDNLNRPPAIPATFTKEGAED